MPSAFPCNSSTGSYIPGERHGRTGQAVSGVVEGRYGLHCGREGHGCTSSDRESVREEGLMMVSLLNILLVGSVLTT